MCRDHLGTCPGPHWAPALAPLASALLLSRAKVPLQGRGRAHTYREQNQLRPNSQSFSSSTSGHNLTPDSVRMATEHRRSPGSPLTGSSHAISSPTSHQGDSCQCTLAKYMTHAHFRSSSPTKGTGNTQTAQGCSQTRTPLQDWES